MASYRVRINPSAVRELEGLPDKHRRLVSRRIQRLGSDPRPPECEKLAGDDRYRVRQGDHRVVCSVDDEARELVIVKIGNRRDVYR